MSASFLSCEQQNENIRALSLQVEEKFDQALHIIEFVQSAMFAAHAWLPSTIRLDRPKSFEGRIDAEALEAWLFHLNQYFTLTGLQEGNARARFALILFTGAASVRLQRQNFDWDIVNWDDLVSAMRAYFCPPDYHRRARAELRHFVQHSDRNVNGYVTAFRRVAAKVAEISDDELFDRFVTGLRPRLTERVLLSAAETFDEACVAAERARVIFSDFQHYERPERPGRDSNAGKYIGKGSGYTPMEGINQQLREQGQRNSGQGSRTPFRGKCYHCGKEGHRQDKC